MLCTVSGSPTRASLDSPGSRVRSSQFLCRRPGDVGRLLDRSTRRQTVTFVKYDDDPSRLNDPLQSDELTALVADQGHAFGRDTRKFAHFVSRSSATINQLKDQIQRLHHEFQKSTSQSTSIGRPTTMDPATAAQYLPMEEVAKLFDAHMVDRLAIQTQIEEDVRSAKAEAIRRVNRVKFVVTGILDDDAVDDATKQKLRDALSALPTPEEEAATADPGSPTPPPPAAPAAPTPPVDSGGNVPGIDDLFGS